MFAFASATNASELMDELERFIPFWYGPHRAEYGVPHDRLARRGLPGPLRRLYEFAGRWERPCSCCPAGRHWIFAHDGDRLRTFDDLELADGGKLAFADEVQDAWRCATLTEGDDPPVWVEGDWNETPQWERVSDSLARFLVTFCLRLAVSGAPSCVADAALTRRFQDPNVRVEPLWLDGGSANPNQRDSFYLLDGRILVWQHRRKQGHAKPGDLCFAAKDDEGAAFLEAHQAPVVRVILRTGADRPWYLDVRADGSGKLDGPGAPAARFPPGTLDFATVRDQLQAASSSGPVEESHGWVCFFREGHSSATPRRFNDAALAESFFATALTATGQSSGELGRLYREHNRTPS
ncbi:MAG: hypothetical protein P4L84_12680 [Isosphaeraceae bacterium]|nr:hypothetical protein [Isosphaeraceae bacterium]